MEPTAAAIATYLRGLEPNARIRPGLVSNPLARTNWRSVGHDKLVEILPVPEASRETPNLAAVEPALEALFFGHEINVLILNGGDGTIHQTLNAAIRVVDRASATIGKRVPLPLFLFVNGGGMNMLARVFGSRGHPVRTVHKFMARARGGRFGTLPKRGVPLLAVREGDPSLEGLWVDGHSGSSRRSTTGRATRDSLAVGAEAAHPDAPLRYGYIFGSELVFNALTMYERFGQGYPALARFLYEVAAGYALRTEMWNKYGHLLDAPTTPLIIDDVSWDRYTSVVATTVPLQLVKGLVATVRRMASPGGMNAVAVLPTDKGDVIRTIPGLMIGAPARDVIYRQDARRIVLHGNYTLDGERFDRGERRGLPDPQPRALNVIGTSRVVWGVWL